jgi:hypothetical protein
MRRTASALIVAVLLASLGLSCTEPPRDDIPRAQVPEVSTAKIKQARWRIKTERVGSVAKVTRADVKRLKAQRPQLAGLVKDIYDSLFLFPSRKASILRRRFERGAAREVLSSRAGVSPRASRVHIWSRRANIGIQPNSAAAAASRIYIHATGRVGQKRFRLVHRATLWLQRLKTGWKVVGFDVTQGPAKKGSRRSNKEQEKGQEKRAPDKKKRRNA